MKKLLFFLSLILILNTASADNNKQNGPAKSKISQDNKFGGTLIFGKVSDATTMDPAHSADGETASAIVQVYDRLIHFKYGSSDIEPGLAEKWNISKDGLKYTFYLRKGVKFQKTKYFKKQAKFTADDVVFSFKRQFDTKHPYYRVGGPFYYWIAMDMNNIVKDVVKEDNFTVTFILKKPEAPLLSNLAMDFASILSKEYADYLLEEKRPADIGKYPVGTGPFILEKWLRNDRMVFKVNKNYWAGRPYVDELIMRVIPCNSVRITELKAGNIHIMDLPDYEELKSLKIDKNIKFIEQAGLNVAYLAMNTDKSPFNNKLVRKAINMAINKKAIVEKVYAGYGVIAKNPIPPVSWGYNNDIKDYVYSPQEAKKLLERAGYKEGFKTTLWITPTSRPYLPNATRVAKLIQSDLQKIGIKTDIISYDWSAYIQKLHYGEHDMALFGWTGDTGDPDNFLYVLLSSKAANKPALNIAFYKNKQFDELVEKAKLITDIKERTMLYKKAQEIFHEDAPWVPLVHSLVVEPVRINVMDFQLDPVAPKRFLKVWLLKKTE